MKEHGTELGAALKAYDWPGGLEARSRLTDLAGKERRASGHLSLKTVQKVTKWGFGRSPKGLTETAVRKQTEAAFKLADAGQQDAAVKALCKLPGVGPSTATKILALSNPAESAIYDSRAALGLSDLLGGDGKPLIKIPPGRIIRGSGRLASATDRGVPAIRRRAEADLGRLHPGMRDVKTLEDVEVALFTRGRSMPGKP